MAFSEFEMVRYSKEVRTFIEARRPPAAVRNELDLGFLIEGQMIEIFEVRPAWNNPDKQLQQSIAKATYVKRQNLWKVYCQRADLRWHAYAPEPSVATLKQFLSLVDEDPHGCFWG
ncbi:MAG: hypothetical protein ACI9W6_002368 [Motiliproteus sp.]|jgi:hypothetical protein